MWITSKRKIIVADWGVLGLGDPSPNPYVDYIEEEDYCRGLGSARVRRPLPKSVCGLHRRGRLSPRIWGGLDLGFPPQIHVLIASKGKIIPVDLGRAGRGRLSRQSRAAPPRDLSSLRYSRTVTPSILFPEDIRSAHYHSRLEENVDRRLLRLQSYFSGNKNQQHMARWRVGGEIPYRKSDELSYASIGFSPPRLRLCEAIELFHTPLALSGAAA
jgi:hypothetical protein